jgi:hypothetical protein
MSTRPVGPAPALTVEVKAPALTVEVTFWIGHLCSWKVSRHCLYRCGISCMQEVAPVKMLLIDSITAGAQLDRMSKG